MRWEGRKLEGGNIRNVPLTHSPRGVRLINGGAGSGLLCKVVKVLLPGGNIAIVENGAIFLHSKGKEGEWQLISLFLHQKCLHMLTAKRC